MTIGCDLRTLVESAEISHPGRVAVRSGPNSLTFREVADRSNRAAHLLRALTGDAGIVALLIGNRLEAVELDIALIKAGLGRVSINTRLVYDEIRYIVEDSGARVLVYSPDFAHIVDQLVNEVADLITVALSEVGSGPGLVYEHALTSAVDSRPTCPLEPSAPSLLMYTSGTTGHPKGAVWTFATRRAAVMNMLINELSADAARVMMHVASLSHGSGSKVVPVYLRGGCNHISSSFDPESFLQDVSAQRGTATFLVPTMVQMLIDAASHLSSDQLGTMRHISYGGAKMPAPTIQSALGRFGNRFFQVYGSCEAPHPMLYLDQYEHASADARILSCAGRPSIGVDVQVGGQPPVPGVQGEIALRGPSVMSGYWRSDGATREAFEQGFYKTGDVGLVHGDGLIEIVDRIKNMIISGGFNVYPAEIERVLVDHPHVAQACVYGLPDPRWGEIVVAAVQLKQAVDEAELVDFCRSSMAGYKKPQSFLFVDEFPLGPTGKVLVNELRQRHAEQAAR